MASSRKLTADDIQPRTEYAANRNEHRRRVAARKRNRRVEIGPHITFYFECRETMWLQVQEMLHIEKSGPEQVPDERAAYNPLVPDGSELVATFMVEIDDPLHRGRVLGGLGGIEETAFLRVGGELIRCLPEADQDRTTAEGKASSVQFVHFPFTVDQIAAFSTEGAEIVLGFDHRNYRHMTIIPEAVRAELSGDFG